MGHCFAESHHSATLSDALRAHDSDVREAVGRAVAAEGKRLAGLVQAAVDEVETRHRHDIKAAVAACVQATVAIVFTDAPSCPLIFFYY